MTSTRCTAFPELDAWLSTERALARRQAAEEAQALAAFGPWGGVTPAAGWGAIGSAGAAYGAFAPSGGAFSAFDQYVDVYTSAGRFEGERSCHAKDGDRGCDLWRVRLGLRSGRVVEVARVRPAHQRQRPLEGCASGTGEVEPAVSPGETGLAYLRRCDTSENGVRSRLVTRTLGEEGTTTIVEGDRGPDLPHWPAWYDDDLLVWQTGHEDGSGGVASASTLWLGSAARAPFPILGPGGLLRTDTRFGDPAVHPDPAYRTGAGLRLLTFGGQDDALVPRVTSITGTEEEEFELYFAGEGETEQCHHPAWNLSGDRVMCHRHEPAESPYGDRRTLRHSFLFRFSGSRGTWVGVDGPETPVFAFPSAEDLAGALPTLPSETCRDYFVKYAEWCGTDDFGIATVYCVDRDQRVVGSRVVIFRIGADPVEFLDVTHLIAVASGDEANGASSDDASRWGGVFATCTPAHRTSDWAPIAGTT